MEDFSSGTKITKQRKYTYEDKSLGADFHSKNQWGMNPNIDVDDEKPAVDFESLMKEEEREELRKL